MASFVPVGFESSGLVTRSAKEPPVGADSVFSADMVYLPINDAKDRVRGDSGGVAQWGNRKK